MPSIDTNIAMMENITNISNVNHIPNCRKTIKKQKKDPKIIQKEKCKRYYEKNKDRLRAYYRNKYVKIGRPVLSDEERKLRIKESKARYRERKRQERLAEPGQLRMPCEASRTGTSGDRTGQPAGLSRPALQGYRQDRLSGEHGRRALSPGSKPAARFAPGIRRSSHNGFRHGV